MKKIFLARLSFVVLLLSILGCSEESSMSNADETVPNMTRDSISSDTTEEPAPYTYTYLALGDSYTIGESVEENDRWPMQLAGRGVSDNKNVVLSRIIARTGWTTGELLEGIEAANIDTNRYDFVSLLIGVNNQFRGMDTAIYQAEFRELLEKSIDFASGDTSRVFVVSIPDWGVTPFASNRDSEKIAEEIDQYNAYAEATAKDYNLKYFYITDISREAARDTTLLAEDRLHPSGRMYRRWVDRIYPWLQEKLK